MQRVDLDVTDMFTATTEVPSLIFVDALVEADEEVQEYRSQGGGPMTVTADAEIYLGHFAPGQDEATPFAERYHNLDDGTFSVLDGIRICPEVVWIDHFGMSFRLNIASRKLDSDGEDPDFGTIVDLPLHATVALLNERLVFF
jgi:hypothetical protein